MFIWDFVADTVLGQIIDWLYGQIVGFLGDFFMQMGSMGAELFEMSWVQSVVLHASNVKSPRDCTNFSYFPIVRPSQKAFPSEKSSAIFFGFNSKTICANVSS